VVVSLCGCHLLGDRRFIALVSPALEALAVELVEVDAVGLVGDEEIEHGPDERQAAVLAGEAAHDLGAAFDLAEGSLEQIRRSPSAAVPGWVAQVRHERVQIVGQAPSGARSSKTPPSPSPSSTGSCTTQPCSKSTATATDAPTSRTPRAAPRQPQPSAPGWGIPMITPGEFP